MDKLIVHLISDSTGETLQVLSKAIFSQFEDLKVKEYLWSMIRSDHQLEKLFTEISAKSGIVMLTVTEKNLKKKIISYCEENKIYFFEPLTNITKVISQQIGKKPSQKIGNQHTVDSDQYQQRIEAMNFTISHDDGIISGDIDNADIVLFGPSRTSKSPTSMYLAFKGFKTANIPLVGENKVSLENVKSKNTFFIGLTISPKRLVEIRKNRLISMGEKQETKYTDLDAVKDEVINARKFCLLNKIPIIDVTRRSVEEISALIIQMYYERDKKKA